MQKLMYGLFIAAAQGTGTGAGTGSGYGTGTGATGNTTSGPGTHGETFHTVWCLSKTTLAAWQFQKAQCAHSELGTSNFLDWKLLHEMNILQGWFANFEASGYQSSLQTFEFAMQMLIIH